MNIILQSIATSLLKISVCFSKYPTLKTRNSTKTMYALINIIFATQIFFFYFFYSVAYLVDEFSILPRTVKSLADICSSSLPSMRNKMQYPISNMYTLRNTDSGVDSRKERTPSRTMAGRLGKVCNLYFEILKILRCLKTSTTTCKIDFFWMHWIYLRAHPRRYLSFLHVQHWETLHATIFFMYATYISEIYC